MPAARPQVAPRSGPPEMLAATTSTSMRSPSAPATRRSEMRVTWRMSAPRTTTTARSHRHREVLTAASLRAPQQDGQVGHVVDVDQRLGREVEGEAARTLADPGDRGHRQPGREGAAVDAAGGEPGALAHPDAGADRRVDGEGLVAALAPGGAEAAGGD